MVPPPCGAVRAREPASQVRPPGLHLPTLKKLCVFYRVPHTHISRIYRSRVRLSLWWIGEGIGADRFLITDRERETCACDRRRPCRSCRTLPRFGHPGAPRPTRGLRAQHPRGEGTTDESYRAVHFLNQRYARRRDTRPTGDQPNGVRLAFARGSEKRASARPTRSLPCPASAWR